jgi:N-acetylmuramoyl-L-alanine amidase
VRIAISPDENPGDSGAVSADGYAERGLNVMVCMYLARALARCGQDAWFNPDITYVERVARANVDGTAVLVACAHNESTPGRSGTQFVFCTGGPVFGRQGEAARAVYAALANIPGWPPRVADAIEDVYECCQFSGDTVYCELLYMSPEDEAIWSRPGYFEAAGEAMAQGLARAYGFAYVPLQPPPFSWWATASG